MSYESGMLATFNAQRAVDMWPATLVYKGTTYDITSDINFVELEMMPNNYEQEISGTFNMLKSEFLASGMTNKSCFTVTSPISNATFTFEVYGMKGDGNIPFVVISANRKQ